MLSDDIDAPAVSFLSFYCFFMARTRSACSGAPFGCGTTMSMSLYRFNLCLICRTFVDSSWQIDIVGEVRFEPHVVVPKWKEQLTLGDVEVREAKRHLTLS